MRAAIRALVEGQEARVSPRTRVVAFSGLTDEDTRAEMAAAGARAFVVKGAPLQTILKVLYDALSSPHSLPELP